MTRSFLCCVSALTLLMAAAPAGHAQPRAGNKQSASSPANSAGDDCEARIRKLDASDAEGEERLAEKNDVISRCDMQYRRDRTIERLLDECSKYEEQPIIKQHAVADCQIAAFSYANALRTLKAEYRK